MQMRFRAVPPPAAAVVALSTKEVHLAEPKSFYITTPIYYVNGVPHVGSATTTILCDAIARWRRQRGERVVFVTGTDEHAQKVADAAAKNGKQTPEFVDDVSQRFVDCWRFMKVSNDDFIRTSQERHKRVVTEVFRRLKESGDIYVGVYEGWYSVADETFLRDSEVKDGRAIDSGALVQRITEDVYYFKLSAYGDKLLAHIHENPTFLMPKSRENEAVAFIEGGLRDLAISRRNAGWGIPVPGDDSNVIYVWFDAVINYLTVTGWPNDPNWSSIWPADLHLVGKEIYTRFHATLWPAMLMALGLEQPAQVLGHGWWLVGGEKGAKSKGNIPTPQDAVATLVSRSGASEDIAVDALRYYLIKDISFTGDAEFSMDALFGRYNSDLANDLGNLLNRSLKMLKQYRDGVVPHNSASRTSNSTLALLAQMVTDEVEAALMVNDPGAALTAIFRLIGAGNKEIDTAAPWKRNKDGDADGVDDALYASLETLRIASVLLDPHLPSTAAAIRSQLGLANADTAPPIPQALTWGQLPAGLQTREAEPIFPRIVKENIKPVTELSNAAPNDTPAAAPAAPATVPTDLITIDQFAQIQLRIAEIKTAEAIPGAKKLLKLTVDAGDPEHRQLVAGIAESYAPEDLPGKKIVIVANLQPAKIRGVESHGMLLAATNAEGIAILLTPEDAGIDAGSKVK